MAMFREWTLCLIVVCCALVQISECQSSEESRLFAYLQARYKSEYKFTRPVHSHEDNVTVGIGITLIDIQDFNTATGFGTFYCYDKMSWKDAHLVWVPQQFGGLTEMRMPSEMIWKPDVVLYNSQDMVPERFESMVVVQHTGDVLWVPRSKYHIRCFEPEDGSAEFECNLKFGSWVYNGYQLDPTLYSGVNETDVTQFFGNHHYEIVENSAQKTVAMYDCCDEPYPNINFRLKLNYNGPTNAAAATGASMIGTLLLALVAGCWLKE